MTVSGDPKEPVGLALGSWLLTVSPRSVPTDPAQARLPSPKPDEVPFCQASIPHRIDIIRSEEFVEGREMDSVKALSPHRPSSFDRRAVSGKYRRKSACLIDQNKTAAR